MGGDHGGVGGGQLFPGLDCPAGMGAPLHMGPVVLGAGGGDAAEGAVEGRGHVAGGARRQVGAGLRGWRGPHACRCPPLLVGLHASTMHLLRSLALREPMGRLLAVLMVSEQAGRGWVGSCSLVRLAVPLPGAAVMGAGLVGPTLKIPGRGAGHGGARGGG